MLFRCTDVAFNLQDEIQRLLHDINDLKQAGQRQQSQMMAAYTQLESVQVSTSVLAVVSESLLLTDVQLINIVFTLQFIAQEMCLEHVTKYPIIA